LLQGNHFGASPGRQYEYLDRLETPAAAVVLIELELLDNPFCFGDACLSELLHLSFGHGSTET
jgi:hypothetical protein